MCGRYALSANALDIALQFEADGSSAPSLPVNWNISPTTPIYFIQGQSPDGNSRIVNTAHWGLIPSWSKDASRASNAINARVESIAEKPSFKSALRSRRCLIPANGYYEWATELGPYPPKQPFYISHSDSTLLPMAGLFEYWKDPETGQMITSASIITRESVGNIATIHHRMPVMLPKDRWSAWLSSSSMSESQVPEYLDLLETPDPEAGLQFHPVAPAVNNARNFGQELSAPITLGEPETLF
jgi:putative SOS response-associated peptidase YedK